MGNAASRFRRDRAALLERLRSEGILHAAADQPVCRVDGTPAPWMLYSLAVTLRPEGAALAGRCLLELLKGFDGRQLATYGTIGIPLLQAVLMESRGRYRGLLVRKERKAYGACRLIEGTIDPAEPVILIDDSISSGTSMERACAHLEAAGLRVEGGGFLVRFGWYAGFGRMRERGYHGEALYDIWEDFMRHMPGEARPPENPTKPPLEIAWAPAAAPEGLHPAALARLVIESWLDGGTVPRPPLGLDRRYDGSGGVWVSVRERDRIHCRHARNGHWHFPGEPRDALPRDLVLAAVRTARERPGGAAGREVLRRSALAVTFFSALEPCTVGELDNDRYGIVVCSRERSGWMGGALPNMPGIAGEWAQFQHARRKNARLVSFEPYQLYRHRVRKAVEPGVRWQPTGVAASRARPWELRPAGAGALAGEVLAGARALLAGRDWAFPGQQALPPADPPRTIFVTLYLDGRVRGCMGAAVRRPAGELPALVRAALSDPRFRPALRPEDGERLAATLSVLSNPLELGVFSPEEVMERVLVGRQALLAWQGERQGLLLPAVAVTGNLEPVAYAREVLDKAGITRPPYRWLRWDCASWLADGGSPRLLGGAFPREDPPPADDGRLLSLAGLLAGYLRRRQLPDGRFEAWYYPCRAAREGLLDLPRQAQATWVLLRAAAFSHEPGLEQAARRSLRQLVGRAWMSDGESCWLQGDDASPSIAEAAFLLLGLCHLPEGDPVLALAPSLARTLWAQIDRHGRLSTHLHPGPAQEAYQDYYPGQALLALGVAALAGLAEARQDLLAPAFRFYRHRFRYKRHWGQPAWLMQAWAAWWWATRDGDFAAHLFEQAEWVMSYQLRKSGAIINDHQALSPGFTTGLYLEGLAAAAGVARELGDRPLARALEESCRAGFRFLDRLVLQERDRALLPDPAQAFGGVRESEYLSRVRLDYVSHALSAVLNFISAQGLAERLRQALAGQDCACLESTKDTRDP